MINYNLAIFETLYKENPTPWMWGAVLLYFVIMILLALGNLVSTKLLKPTYPGWGRILFGALIMFSINVAFSLFFFQLPPVLTTICTLVAWYFVVKFLFDYTWVKAIGAWIIPIITLAVGMIILWYAIPGGWVNKILMIKAW